MYGNSTDESIISDSISTAPSTTLNVLAMKSPESVCRVGSGSSAILDAEGGTEVESRKLPSSRFKGVVPQPNGRWGAQIYEKHQRVWLGTFNEEDEAARAYDIAAQRFRGRDAITNFKPEAEEDNAFGLIFLNSHSKAEIVDMLRKHTYNDELEQSKRKFGKLGFDANGNRVCKGGISTTLCGLDKGPKARQELFKKSVTPSDVGKLNRLVIPKQHAEKYFPLHSSSTTLSNGVLLNFEDVSGKVWRFRYSYWKSSQSYVLTKGWSRFVKEKKLKAGDTVSFHRSIGNDSQLYIDWKHSNNVPCDEDVNGVISCSIGAVKMLRLFGVDIIKVPGSNVNVVDSINTCGKRDRGIDLIAVECCKKQRFINVL